MAKFLFGNAAGAFAANNFKDDKKGKYVLLGDVEDFFFRPFNELSNAEQEVINSERERVGQETLETYNGARQCLTRSSNFRIKAAMI